MINLRMHKGYSLATKLGKDEFLVHDFGISLRILTSILGIKKKKNPTLETQLNLSNSPLNKELFCI